MSIIRNHFYNIVFEKNDMMKILMKMDELKDIIYPQTSQKLVDAVEGIQQYEGQNPYQDILDDMMNIMDLLNIKEQKQFQIDEKIDLKYTKEFINEIEQRVFDIQETRKSIELEKEENRQAIQLLKHLKKEKYSLDDLQNLKYMTVRFGKLPKQQESKLEYYQEEQFIYKELSRDNQYIWIVYCSDNQNISMIDNIFSSMSFEFIHLPSFAHGKIEMAIEELDKEAITMEKYIETLNQRIEAIKDENKDVILLYYNKVAYLKMLFDRCRYVYDLDNKAMIYAYSPYDKNEMMEKFGESVTIIQLPENIYYRYGIISPVIVKNNDFVKPFEKLIKFKDGDVFDPTILYMMVLMISALLIGDLGLGVAFVLISVIFKGKMMPILQRLAIPVLAGGILTGSLFYSFTLYQPLFMLSDLFIRFIMFIFINIIAYLLLMIVKDIQRKRYLSKEGYNGNFKAQFSER